MVATYVNALINNDTLKVLRLCNSNTITAAGWGAFSTLLCDRSSVESTYLSNHTLSSLGYYRPRIGHDLLKRHLKMNEDENKKHVAIRKILIHMKISTCYPSSNGI